MQIGKTVYYVPSKNNSLGYEKIKIQPASCPKCSSDIVWYVAWSENMITNVVDFDKHGYHLAQCSNQSCNIVTHTGSKLCQGNVCEWHEICTKCHNEICGDFMGDGDKAQHLEGECYDMQDLLLREAVGF